MDAFGITIIFVIISTFVAAFVRGRKKDKCLKDFGQNMTTLEETNGKIIWGKLRVETTGLEFIYQQKHKDKDGRCPGNRTHTAGSAIPPHKIRVRPRY